MRWPVRVTDLNALVPLVVGVIAIACTLVAGNVWLTQGWIHPELIESAYRVWHFNAPTLPQHFWLALLDYGALHDRARLISYLAEVIDILSRPSLVPLIGFHPSLTVVGIITALVCPVLLFALLRSYALHPLLAAVLVALFVLSPGFLSVLALYLRPAKRLAMLAMLATLLLARRYEQRPRPRSFVLMVTALFAGFFVDEACLATYAVLPVVYGPMFIQKFRRWQWAVYLSLPVFFVIVAVWGLPALFAMFGATSPIDLSDDATFGVRLPPFAAFATPLYHLDWLTMVARAVLTTFGVRPLGVSAEIIIAVMLILAALGLGAWAFMRPSASSAAQRLALWTVALMMGQGYATWLDYLPTREDGVGRAWLASFNYYYDSWAVIFVVLWFAALWQTLMAISSRARGPVIAGGLIVTAFAVVSTPTLFNDFNRQVEIFHLYPYDSRDVHAQMALHAAQLQAHVMVEIPVHDERVALAAEYEAISQRLYGGRPRLFGIDRWAPPAPGDSLERLVPRAPGGGADGHEGLAWLVQIYFPNASVSVVPILLAKDSLNQVWLFSADGSRRLLPDADTYFSYGGDPEIETLPTIADGEFQKSRWSGLSPSVSYASNSVAKSSPNGARPEGPAVTFGPVDLPVGSKNLALGRTAKQSDGGSSAGLAIDGNTSGVGADMSIASASDYQPLPWWQVDLGESRAISYLQIWPRTDACCLDRLNNLTAFVSDQELVSDDPYHVQGRPDVSSVSILGIPSAPTTIAIRRTARFVRIQMAHPGLLDLAEVQVWNDPTAGSASR